MYESSRGGKYLSEDDSESLVDSAEILLRIRDGIW
jgi:hypothetical protein